MLISHTKAELDAAPDMTSAEWDALKARPIKYTKDCPKMTAEQLAQFHRVKLQKAV